MCHSTRLLLTLQFLVLLAPKAFSSEPAASTDKSPVTATIETTLHTASQQIRQFAFDGDRKSYFSSRENPGPPDHFTLVFYAPVAIDSIAVITGRPDGADALDGGTLLTSTDGKTFTDRATFSHGASYAIPGSQPIRAIRIKPSRQLRHPLAIREIKVESNPPLAVFKFPVEFIVEVADAPEIKDWAMKVASECERSYAMINEELKSDGYKPPTIVTMELKKDYDGVAAASDGRITGSVKYFLKHPDDVGAMIHETTHIVQRYDSPNNPGWLVEGVSDYVRFFKYEPGKIGPIDPDRAHYNDAYRTTAAFLAYVTERYDPQIVRKLNALMRDGKYTNSTFKQLTGKSEKELDDEWRATLRASRRRRR